MISDLNFVAEAEPKQEYVSFLDTVAVGLKFQKLLYSYHSTFFKGINKKQISKTFENIWTLCLKNDPVMKGHHRDVFGISATKLAKVYKKMSNNEKYLLLFSIVSALREEVRNDRLAGRPKLANMLDTAISEILLELDKL